MTIKRILEVTKNYAIRHFFKDKNFIKPFLFDLSDVDMSRITTDTPNDKITSILFCDFHEKNEMAFNTVKFFKENPDQLITDNLVPVKNFTYWYGISPSKRLTIGKLEDLADEMEVMPVRNIRSIIKKPFNSVFVTNNIIYFKNPDNFCVQIPYALHDNNVGKCVLVSPDSHSLFIYGVRSLHTEEIKQINEYLQKHPSFPVLVDNGRYLFYFFGEEATKEAFCCGGFAEIDAMYTFGSVKD